LQALVKDSDASLTILTRVQQSELNECQGVAIFEFLIRSDQKAYGFVGIDRG